MSKDVAKQAHVTEPEPAAKEKSNRFLTFVLSSGILGTVCFLLASLFGSLYHVGYLNAFGIPADAFPGSAENKAIWGFGAALHLFNVEARAYTNDVQSHMWFALKVASVLTAVILSLERFNAWWFKSGSGAVQRWLAKVHWTSVRPYAAIFVTTFAIVFGAPHLLLMTFLAFSLVPVAGHSAGGEEAATQLTHWKDEQSKPKDERRCTSVLSPLGNFACVLVIAESGEMLAFMDGTGVHILPSKDLTMLVVEPKPRIEVQVK